MNFLKRVHYNSPLILSFSLLSALIFFLDMALGNSLRPLFSLGPDFQLGNPVWYLSLFTYTMGHASTEHLMGNMTFILLLGPAIEERYGTRNLLVMMLITAFSTAILNTILFSTGILGASGIVFMLIILSSLTNMRHGQIPLTFILVVILFVGKEVIDSFSNDNVSQFGHIMGGICGAVFGFMPVIQKRLTPHE